MAKYLAADIGASSGRIFEAVLNDRKIELREIFRFDDYLRYEEKTYFWDIEKIYGSIISVGVLTWIKSILPALIF